jgi:hypothetical protein
MRIGRAAGFSLVVLALALGTVGCGGGGHSTTNTSAKIAADHELHWRQGLVRWHRSMYGALYGISIMFSTDASVGGIADVHSRISARLVRYERTLITCNMLLARLGATPATLVLAGRYAEMACKNLAKGEKLVERAAIEIRTSMPLDPLADASGPLSTAESEMDSALVVLQAPQT